MSVVKEEAIWRCRQLQSTEGFRKFIGARGCAGIGRVIGAELIVRVQEVQANEADECTLKYVMLENGLVITIHESFYWYNDIKAGFYLCVSENGFVFTHVNLKDYDHWPSPALVWKEMQEAVYDARDGSSYNRQLRILFRFIEGAFENRNLGVINEFLGIVLRERVENTQPLTMVAILRASSRAKYQIGNWRTLRDKVYAELEGWRMRDRLMQGLLDTVNE